MVEQDTVKLLRECDAGVKMGTQSIDDVIDKVESDKLRQLLSECKIEHEKLNTEIQSQLDRFKDEGKNLLVDEFGKQYGTYFSILDAISNGINTQSDIAAALGEKSIGGQLKKLEETYEVIQKMRPILAKKGTQTVRYGISDM